MPSLHTALVWLEVNVRKPLEGSLIDKAVFTPAKQLYLDTRKQS